MKSEKKERCVLTSVIETELDILKRHISVLKVLQENQPMGIIKISELTKYPQHICCSLIICVSTLAVVAS